jgi:CoA:oxalate CoA-transferase
MVATSEYFPTGEGWIALGANHQHQVKALLEVLGYAELIDDPRFRDHAARVANYDEVRAWLVDTLSRERAADLELRLTAAGVPAAMLRDIREISEHPHIVERGLIEEVDLPGSDRPLATVGPGFAVEKPASPLVVPTLGADTDAVLAELGYDTATIETMRQAGAI